jgi:uncharacterized membrane protein
MTIPYFSRPYYFNFKMTTANIILAITTLTTALIAGLLYAYSCSVNGGLARLSDANYILAMQAINKAILNPAFLFSFIGTLFLLPICTYLHYNNGDFNRFYLLLFATIIYLIGVILITAFGNIPLNNSLDSFSVQSTDNESITKARLAFENAWNNFHLIRTIASIVALILVILACLKNK